MKTREGKTQLRSQEDEASVAVLQKGLEIVCNHPVQPSYLCSSAMESLEHSLVQDNSWWLGQDEGRRPPTPTLSPVIFFFLSSQTCIQCSLH